MIRGERRQKLRKGSRRSRTRTPGKFKAVEDVAYETLRKQAEKDFTAEQKAKSKLDQAVAKIIAIIDEHLAEMTPAKRAKILKKMDKWMRKFEEKLKRKKK